MQKSGRLIQDDPINIIKKNNQYYRDLVADCERLPADDQGFKSLSSLNIVQ